MVLANLLYSMMPLVLSRLDGSGHPFLFSMGWRMGVCAGFALFLAVGYPRLFFSGPVWAIVLCRCRDWKFLGTVTAYFDIVLLALSARFIDISVATIIVGVSPIFLMVVISLSYRRTGTYQKLTLRVLALAALALAGFTGVVYSQAGGIRLSDSSANWSLGLGILLALASALILAFNGFIFRFGTDLSAALPVQGGVGASSLFGVVLAGMLANMVSIPVCFVIGLSVDETIPGRMLLFTVVGGALIYPAAGIFWRKANLITHNLGINAIGYLYPVMSLLWLWPFSLIGAARVDYLLFGTATIVVANLLIHRTGLVRSR